MNIDKSIRKILVDEDVNIGQLAEKIGTSYQNISAKLKRNNLRVSEMQEIADILGYELIIQFNKKEKD